MSSKDTLKFIAPEFEDEPDATLDKALALAAQRINAGAFGQTYEQAAVFMAAHILKLRALSSGASAAQKLGFVGPVTSVKSGDLSLSGPGLPAGNSGNDDETGLSRTEYGRSYLDLRAGVPVSPFNVKITE